MNKENERAQKEASGGAVGNAGVMGELWQVLTKCLFGKHDWVYTEGRTFRDGKYLAQWRGRACKRCIIAGSARLYRSIDEPWICRCGISNARYEQLCFSCNEPKPGVSAGEIGEK